MEEETKKPNKKDALYADEIFQYYCEHKLIYAKNGGVNTVQEPEEAQSELNNNED